MVKKKIMSLIGSIISLIGITGILLSSAIAEILFFVIAAMSGLFAIAVTGQKDN
jgi:uncharacterized membrane protein YbaN (DUF454 family)